MQHLQLASLHNLNRSAKETLKYMKLSKHENRPKTIYM